MVSDFLRFYPAYTVNRMKKELSRRQLNSMLEAAWKRPWGFSVMVEPKER